MIPADALIVGESPLRGGKVVEFRTLSSFTADFRKMEPDDDFILLLCCTAGLVCLYVWGISW